MKTARRLRVTVEDFPLFPTPNVATVYPKALDLPAIARGDIDCENCVDLRMSAETFLEDPAALADFEGIVRLESRAPTPGMVLALHATGRREKTELCIDPANVGEGGVALMAASLDIPLTLEPTIDWPEGILEQLTDYFLYSPTLRVPIRPLAGISAAMADEQTSDLWRANLETLGTDFYVDARNRVTLSPRWAAAGRFFGTVADGQETWSASELWRHIEGLEDRRLVELSPCATCRHFRHCRAFWRAGVRENEDCSAWQACMDQIAEAYRQSLEEEPV